MLYGKIARSSVPHGKILSIDPSAALALDGVYAVITGDDIRRLIPNPYYGPAFHDQPILALEKVRYAGEPVAVALAKDPHVAEEAADLIAVEYEPLEAVFDEVAAAKPGAPIIHDVLKPATTFPDLKHLQGRSGTNVALSAHVRRGDLEKAFKESDHVFEQTFHNGARALCDGRRDGRPRWIDDSYRIAKPILRAIGNQPSPGLARKSGSGSDGFPGRRFWWQALHQARSAGCRMHSTGSKTGPHRSDNGRAVLHDHEARRDSAAQDGSEEGRPHGCA